MLADKVARFKLVTIVRAHKYVGAVSAATSMFPALALQIGDYQVTEQTYVQDVLTDGTVNYPSLVHNTLLMYNIFVPVSIHNIYISKIIFKLIKKHLYATKPLQLTAGTQTISVVDLKFPVEYVFFGIKVTPDAGVEQSLFNMEYWHRYVDVDLIDSVQLDPTALSVYKSAFADAAIFARGDVLPAGIRRGDI